MPPLCLLLHSLGRDGCRRVFLQVFIYVGIAFGTCIVRFLSISCLAHELVRSFVISLCIVWSPSLCEFDIS